VTGALLSFSNGSQSIIPLVTELYGNMEQRFTTPQYHECFPLTHSYILHRALQKLRWPAIRVADIFYSRIHTIDRGDDNLGDQIYETIWYMTSSVDVSSTGDLSDTRLHARTAATWERSTQVDVLMGRVEEEAREVDFLGAVPTRPFETAYINDAVWTDRLWVLHRSEDTHSTEALPRVYTEDDTESPPQHANEPERIVCIPASYPVNRVPSCSAFFRCTSLPVQYSCLCQPHHDRAMRAAFEHEEKRLGTLIVRELAPHRIIAQADWQMLTGVCLEQLRRLQAMTTPMMRDTFLLVDSEFWVARHCIPTIFQLAIGVLGRNSPALFANVAYPGVTDWPFDHTEFPEIQDSWYFGNVLNSKHSRRQAPMATWPEIQAKLQAPPLQIGVTVATYNVVS